MKKKEVFLLSSLSFSFGVIIGFFISPVKRGIYNIAGNNIKYHYDEKDPSIGISSEDQANQ
ncbi:hypothetical protein [Heyndrickxia camelliae]|uniref:Uncharacterized protein n=1 Tax=Heyndrickxia camelliae TaxID=1707093 RepID=A0A2N3LHQ7_9BACI|nr:hypothetical protein [Heyndrickxia camelliae]PKR84172.1 hypothetical protein CWO92_15305 [Heyndrickxia camelliae]